MAETETYVLRLSLPLRVLTLAFFFVQVLIVLNGPDGYHPPRVEAQWPFLYWFFLITLPLSLVLLLFLPWTLRTCVSDEGLSQSFYVGVGPFKLWHSVTVLRWSEVESVKKITIRSLVVSSAKAVHFVGSTGDTLRSIGISASYTGGYKAALAFALRHVHHAHIEEGVEELAA